LGFEEPGIGRGGWKEGRKEGRKGREGNDVPDVVVVVTVIPRVCVRTHLESNTGLFVGIGWIGVFAWVCSPAKRWLS